MQLKIIKASIILTNGQDHVSLETNLPSALPEVTKQPLSIRFEVEKNKGQQYINEHIGVEVEIINARTKDI